MSEAIEQESAGDTVIVKKWGIQDYAQLDPERRIGLFVNTKFKKIHVLLRKYNDLAVSHASLDITQFSDLPLDLDSVVFSGCNLLSLKPLLTAKQVNLTNLTLEHCKFEEKSLECLSKFGRLKTLKVNYCALSRITGVEKLLHLETLELHGNNIQDPLTFKSVIPLKKLQQFGAAKNKIPIQVMVQLVFKWLSRSVKEISLFYETIGRPQTFGDLQQQYNNLNSSYDAAWLPQ
ncbi:Leucine-rich_repeat domain superfamily [Hexamita inflata]|uniref:Leucine-rich repeat domain superfamily n=1 Tax=Hexamita inflata TaxID=28002 RepID=A0AA86U7C1_9EUKA|nr:Leucine-rich repeat domain superfamily [Hexamita inflata]